MPETIQDIGRKRIICLCLWRRRAVLVNKRCSRVALCFVEKSSWKFSAEEKKKILAFNRNFVPSAELNYELRHMWWGVQVGAQATIFSATWMDLM